MKSSPALPDDVALDDRAGGEVLDFVAVDELAKIARGVAERGGDGGIDFVIELPRELIRL